MTILALEFSSAQRSAAVVHRGGHPHISAEAVETGTGGTNAFRLIERVLAEAKVEREQIEVLAVGLGPGSYAGVRVAISIAQGWQLARGVKLLGISSSECLAAQARVDKNFDRVNVVIDAQRNEFYLASYEISPEGSTEIEPLRIVSLTELQSRARAGGIWVGPEVTRWLPGGQILFPAAAALGRLAARRSDFVGGGNLSPIYLRETNFVKARPVGQALK
ncbi:MAG TPA: tRNA (adenosine(37)-N6)-threonylcarbamoyltransferase complex dimerization subunit type 1 TsaB [Verrucomicrobiae bacterium]|nr:tRNA (adenosine(37)-N6)-threonylcarbamoyltransferase complex dimerization subunit type 1 TsaB [Verrucomicrobiae bacterium]